MGYFPVLVIELYCLPIRSCYLVVLLGVNHLEQIPGNANFVIHLANGPQVLKQVARFAWPVGAWPVLLSHVGV